MLTFAGHQLTGDRQCHAVTALSDSASGTAATGSVGTASANGGSGIARMPETVSTFAAQSLTLSP